MEVDQEKTMCKLTEDEWEVIRRIRCTPYGRVGVQVKAGKIILIDCSATVKPPSLEKAQEN